MGYAKKQKRKRESNTLTFGWGDSRPFLYLSLHVYLYICMYICKYIMIVFNVTKINTLDIYMYMCTFSDTCFTYVIVLFMSIYICISKNIYVYIY